MKHPRKDLFAFNPEDFLKDKLSGSLKAPRQEKPIVFSRKFRTELSERLAQDVPVLFDRTQSNAMVDALRNEISKILNTLGITPDRELSLLLGYDLISHPRWRRELLRRNRMLLKALRKNSKKSG